MKAIHLKWQCIGAHILVVAFITLILAACPSSNEQVETPSVVPVTGITGVPSSATAGVPLTLTGTVSPSNATSQTITWTVSNAGATGATITGNVLNTTGAGNVTVTATVANGLAAATPYTQNFTITVNASFVAVSSITGVPSSATAGVPLTLTGTVSPSNATNQTITWTVNNAGATGATISGNVLNTTGGGTATVTATIADGTAQGTPYTQNFTIIISADFVFVPVSEISIETNMATAGISLILRGTIYPSNATNQTIVWTVSNAGTTGATISGNTLNTTGAGNVTITATIANGTAQGTAYTRNFTITVNSTAPAFTPVTNITNVPPSATAGTPLTLSGTVTPANATNQTIAWSVQSAGTTGATISGNTLNTTGAGTVTVTATIANGTAVGTPYTQNFNIIVNAGFVPVTGIANVPNIATAGVPLTLSGMVSPSNATNQTIAWSVQSTGTTGATISGGNVLNTTGAGSVTVTATVANGLAAGTPYTQNFTITVQQTAQQSESFIITFTQIVDEAPEIIGPTIYRSGTNGPRTATIAVDNPGQYSSINWYVTGTTVSGVGSSFTLSTVNILYNNTGQHFLTIEVVKGGVPYNRTIIFTVAP